ncbi:MAG: glycosyltransferase [Bacteroidia bacterium]|nr:glycosyltransferase [Bacteroidia bacterium]
MTYLIIILKKIIFTVINDLTYDQRMIRICDTLSKNGYEVELVGRELPSSISLQERGYQQTRLKCIFNQGKLFYLEYNLRLIFYLLDKKLDIISGVDTDTLFATYVSSKILGKPLVYDAHEYFTEVEEVVNRPVVKSIWQMLESLIIPNLKYTYTVSSGLVDLFKKNYNTDFELIRNVPVLKELKQKENTEKYIIYHGAVNVGRGLEEMIEAMQFIDCKFYICGHGDLYDELLNLPEKHFVQEKVKFFGFTEPEKLEGLIANAMIGVNLLKSKGLSYYHSLANKFFDYIQHGIPQVTVNYPEYQVVNSNYEVAKLVDIKIEEIVDAINTLLNDETHYNKLKESCMEARKEYYWQNEEEKLLDIYGRVN